MDKNKRVADLEAENARLKTENAALNDEFAKLVGEVAELKTLNDWYLEQFRLAQHYPFGPSSEKTFGTARPATGAVRGMFAVESGCTGNMRDFTTKEKHSKG